MRVVHNKKDPYDVYIGRPSKWGNPFSHLEDSTQAKFKVKDRKEAIDSYKEWITEGDGKHLLEDLHELDGKTLGCWCKPKSCHGDVLVKLVEEVIDKKLQEGFGETEQRAQAHEYLKSFISDELKHAIIQYDKTLTSIDTKIRDVLIDHDL